MPPASNMSLATYLPPGFRSAMYGVLSKISATALVFSADGTFLASGRAPLDYTVLRPGDESGFVISVPVNVPVARYRVGFRSEDGRVIGHIDRRTATTMASTSDAPPLWRVRGTS